MTELEIGHGRRARRAYNLSEISIVPSRRTRDPEEVSLDWHIDAWRFGLPILASPMDSVVSPATAIAIGRLGGLGVLDLEGLWTRYDDPTPQLTEIAQGVSLARMQEVYEEPIKEELIGKRIAEVREAGVTTAAALSPQRVVRFHEAVLNAGVDLFVIQGTAVSAEHVSTSRVALNLKSFIADLDVPVIVGGCATYQTALHLMRTGAAGVLVGAGSAQAAATRSTYGIAVPMATALADAAGARRDYLDESGGRYVHVIADGGSRTAGDLVTALACGADAVMVGAPLARATEAPGQGWHWARSSTHPEIPRGEPVPIGTLGSLEQILHGPATTTDGSTGLASALRHALATAGYSALKEFQKVELLVTS
jgi:IMP dehydrogenase